MARLTSVRAATGRLPPKVLLTFLATTAFMMRSPPSRQGVGLRKDAPDSVCLPDRYR
jgi:hypothetical protein